MAPGVVDIIATNTRKCCDLGAHGERSAWLAADAGEAEVQVAVAEEP